jgi:hypothetical protein
VATLEIGTAIFMELVNSSNIHPQFIAACFNFLAQSMVGINPSAR